MDHADHEKRRKPRTLLEPFGFVEFTISRFAPTYQFAIRDVSPSGLGILVRPDSDVLGHLKVGEVLDIKTARGSRMHDFHENKARVRHITRLDAGRYHGHYLVGLEILDPSEETVTNP